MEKIKLVYGLGNEGQEFEKTKHNLGKEIIKKYFKNPKELKNSFYDRYQNLILAVPKGYMNEAGKGLKELMNKFRLKPENLLVIHDEADLVFPFFKISFGSGSGGHKGVESIIQSLKTKNFWRFRIGIQGKKREKAEKIVLKEWNLQEKFILEKIKEKFKIIFEILQRRRPHELNIPKNYFLDESY